MCSHEHDVCLLSDLLWSDKSLDWSMLKVTICGPYTLSLCPGTRLPCLCLCLKWHVFTCLSNTCRCTLFLAFRNKRIAIGWGVERSSSSPFRKALYKVDLTIPLPNLTLNNTHVYYILIVLFYLAQHLFAFSLFLLTLTITITLA